RHAEHGLRGRELVGFRDVAGVDVAPRRLQRGDDDLRVTARAEERDPHVHPHDRNTRLQPSSKAIGDQPSARNFAVDTQPRCGSGRGAFDASTTTRDVHPLALTNADAACNTDVSEPEATWKMSPSKRARSSTMSMAEMTSSSKM